MTREVYCPKWFCSIVITGIPEGLDERTEKMATKYLLYYEWGNAIRAGKRVVDWNEKRPKLDRKGGVRMKDETIEKKAEERLESNKAMELRMMATSVSRRKGITFYAAKAALMMDWNCDANGVGYTVENPRPDPDPEIDELLELDEEQTAE